MRIETVALGRIQPNSYNPNYMKPEQRKALAAMFEKIGYVQPILVRETDPGTYEIIDGEHRWDTLREHGAEEAEVVVIDADEDTAKLATLAMNQIRGRPVPILLAKMLLDLERDLGRGALTAAGFSDGDLKKAQQLAGPTAKLGEAEKLKESRALTVKLLPEQFDLVRSALDRAQQVAETDSDAVALVALAEEFLSTYPDES